MKTNTNSEFFSSLMIFCKVEYRSTMSFFMGMHSKKMSVGFSAIIFGFTNRFSQVWWQNQAHCLSGCCNLSKLICIDGFSALQRNCLPRLAPLPIWVAATSLHQLLTLLLSVSYPHVNYNSSCRTVTQELVFAMHMQMPLGHILQTTYTQAGESHKLTSAATPCIQRQLPTCEVRCRQEYESR